ncbi:Two-component sensor protein yhcY, partial [mine drainage metagenome]
MRENESAPPETALGVLVKLTAHLNESTELEPMLRGALGTLCRMLGERTGWITLGEEHGEPQLIVGVNLPPALEAQGRSALRWGPCRCQRAGTRDESGFSPCERLEMVSGENGGLLYHASTPLRV